MYCGLLLAIFLIAVSADQESVRIGRKWHKFGSRDSSDALRTSKRWIMDTEPGSRIKVYCNDFRLPYAPPESCNYGKVIFDDGYTKTQKCEVDYHLHVESKSSRLIIDLIVSPPGMAFMVCLAKQVTVPKEDETITLALGGGVHKISFPEVRGLDQDRTWKFRSATGGKISLQCDIGMASPAPTGCVRDILTIDNGDKPEYYCAGNDKIVSISRNSEIKMRIELFPDTTGHATCIAQAISGPNPNEHNNVKYPEEDSTEFGVAPGRKRTTCNCGNANKESGRIINGTEAHEGKFPFMVSLRNPGDGHFCGASIITPYHVLTAAHCVSNRWTKSKPVPSELVPTVGVHHVAEDPTHGQAQRLKVKEVFVPPLWFSVNGSLGGDIALLHLETPITYSKWVSPVCLTPTQPPIINKFIKAMGWGLSENGYPDKLREAMVQVLDQQMCNNDPRETCFKSRPSSSCFGDSGGPYVYVDPETNRYTQVALVSYGYAECTGSVFVGTNVVHWYKWIQDHIAATTKDHAICIKQD